MAPHGHAGQVKVKFARNITAKAMGATVRIMLYPNRSIWAYSAFILKSTNIFAFQSSKYMAPLKITDERAKCFKGALLWIDIY